MTEKRLFKVVIDEDTGAENIMVGNDKEYTEISEMCDKLNEQHETIQELQSELQEQVNRKDACIKQAHLLDEENEQLKQQLNYIQNSISEHIKHQKTELGQKALKEVIEDYNEWLLGHKEVSG